MHGIETLGELNWLAAARGGDDRNCAGAEVTYTPESRNMTQDAVLWIEEKKGGMDYRDERRELRAKNVSRCAICGTRTNRWGVYYWMGYPSLRLCCPHRNDGGTGANEVNRKHRKLQLLHERLDRDHLTKKETGQIQTEIAELRRFFMTLREDVIPCPAASSIDT